MSPMLVNEFGSVKGLGLLDKCVGTPKCLSAIQPS